MEGQLWPDERQLLYDTVFATRPNIALEVGTWKGGGSTYQIAMALSAVGHGTLYTCETDKQLYLEASNVHKGNDSVKCFNIPSTQLITNLISASHIPDFVFFDGPEDPDLNLSDFRLLEPFLRPGAVFCAHDWDTGVRDDGLVSTKAKLLRPYLENSKDWEIQSQLTGPVSVGMVVAKLIRR
jgi:predicted O-methyltransferase YrrM